MSSRKTIAKNLRAFRTERGWSQARLAKESGVSISSIKRIELEQIDVTVNLLNRLAESMKIKTYLLIGQ